MENFTVEESHFKKSKHGKSPHASSRKIRLGMIGCGAIAEGAHIPAVLSSSLVELTALSDTNETRLRDIERMLDFGTIGFSDYRDTFDRVDAVILTLPNYLHAPVGSDFLKRGIHVLCEKPLALSLSECVELYQAARSSRSVLAVGYNTRFFPSTELIKQLIDSHFLGKLKSFDYEFGTSGGWASVSGYNLARATSGGGVFPAKIHFIDRMLYFFDDVRVVSYVDDSYGGVEANCVAWFQCKVKDDSLQGSMTLSKTHNLLNRFRIVGEKGTLEVKDSQEHSVTYFPVEGKTSHEISYGPAGASTTDVDSFKLQLEDFVRAIQNGTEPKINGEQGSTSVAIMEKCYEMATRIHEPWVEGPLSYLKAAMPPDAPGMAQNDSVKVNETDVRKVQG